MTRDRFIRVLVLLGVSASIPTDELLAGNDGVLPIVERLQAEDRIQRRMEALKSDVETWREVVGNTGFVTPHTGTIRCLSESSATPRRESSAESSKSHSRRVPTSRRIRPAGPTKFRR